MVYDNDTITTHGKSKQNRFMNMICLSNIETSQAYQHFQNTCYLYSQWGSEK